MVENSKQDVPGVPRRTALALGLGAAGTAALGMRPARAQNKPAIVATQMLESMIENPQPTRAEVSDISNAVFSGSDAIMLSAETASGRYPVRAVQVMDRVARQVEGFLWSEGAFGSITDREETLVPPLPLHVAVARSTAQLSRDLRVRAILVLSHSGVTAGVVSAARPAAPVVAVSPDARVCRRMNLLWGLVPIQVTEADLEQPNVLARRLVRDLDLASAGQYVLGVEGFGTAAGENTPLPRISVITV